MSREKDLNARINIRVNDGDLSKFLKKCRRLEKKHTDFIREIIQAVNNNKLRILDKSKTEIGELYNVD